MEGDSIESKIKGEKGCIRLSCAITHTHSAVTSHRKPGRASCIQCLPLGYCITHLVRSYCTVKALPGPIELFCCPEVREYKDKPTGGHIFPLLK